MSGSIPFEELEQADLLVDRVYESGPSDNVGADPLQRLLPVGNQGGIRYKGSVQGDDIRLVVLYTSGEHPDWPDSVDPYTGTGAYFGDNRRPGQELHATTRQGNEILRLIFDRANGDCTAGESSTRVVFSKSDRRRDVVFRGLAVPGSPAVAIGDELVAVWRAVGQHRFQNYRATFTILDEAVVRRGWLNDLLDGSRDSLAWAARVPVVRLCQTTSSYR